MAEKKKSIIEESLLEFKTIEDALKANTKEILASTMKEEIEKVVRESLEEQGWKYMGEQNNRPIFKIIY